MCPHKEFLAHNSWNGCLGIEGVILARGIWPHFCPCGLPCPRLAFESNKKDISYILIAHSIHLNFFPASSSTTSLFQLSWAISPSIAHLQSPRCPWIMLFWDWLEWWCLKAWALKQDKHEIKCQFYHS